MPLAAPAANATLARHGLALSVPFIPTMTVRRGWAQLWWAGAVCGVAFAMWHRRRHRRALHPSLPRPLASSRPPASPARPAWLPPASVEDDPPWALPSHGAPRAPWLRRASVAIHLGQASELARIARELDAAGYPAAAGVLDNYALLLERSTAKSRILVEVTRLLSIALAEAPTTNPRARAPRRPFPAGEAPTHPVLAIEPLREAPASRLAINAPPADPAGTTVEPAPSTPAHSSDHAPARTRSLAPERHVPTE